MLFGFATTIIAGFLLTAVANWTGIAGLSDKPLGALVLLWLAALGWSGAFELFVWCYTAILCRPRGE